MWSWLHSFASAPIFFRRIQYLLPALSVLLLPILAYGLIGGLYLAPADYQQGDAFRIIYVHVPSAFLSMSLYMLLATLSFIGLVWRIKLCFMLAKSTAMVGAWLTFLALVTGAIWGKPMWGTWWIWDARLTSELLLLFLYMGYLALHNALPDKQKADKISSVLALIGVVNIPIIHYSVVWWNTLHQGATMTRLDRPAIEASMRDPLLAMIVAFFLLAGIMILLNTRNEILRREKKAAWVKQWLMSKASCKRG